MSTLVMKFGGSSVGTTTALTQVLSIVLYERERWERLVLVVSALEGVTDALIEAAHLAQLNNRRGYRRIVATLRTRHMALAEHLPLGTAERSALQADIDLLLSEMLDICLTLADTPTDTLPADAMDAVVGVGERLAARIIAALLRQNDLRGVAIDSTELIVTNDIFGNATPDMALTRDKIVGHLLPMLNRRIIPVVTGFIGATLRGKPTTLGRGGSDYSASILAVCSDADEVWIWTDVDGMMSADPREIDEARVIPHMSYDEVAELAYFGARILHARMIEPLRERTIPLKIKNVYKPQQSGTLVDILSGSQPQVLKAVTSINGIGLTARQSGSLAQIAALVDETLFKTVGTRADVMISSQSVSYSFACFVVPTSAGPEGVQTTQSALETRLADYPELTGWQVHPVTIITAVGAGLDISSNLTGRIFQILDGIKILALAQGPSHCSLSIVVELADANTALQRIHDMIVSQT